MTSRDRTLTIRIVGDDREAQKTLKNIEQSTGQTSTRMGQFAGAVKLGFAAFAGSEALQAIQQVDQLGLRLEATDRRADTVFGSMAESARQWADDNNEAFGIGTGALLGLEAAVGDLLVPMGFARDEALLLSQEVLNTANALSEWTGGTRSAQEAQEIITKAILGERDGLVELGVKISEADVQQRLLEKGQENLTGTALEQAKAMATLELITGKSSDALAAYEDRAGSAIATNKEMAASTEDAAESFAIFLKPELDAAKSAGADLLTVGSFLAEKLRDLRSAGEEAGEGQASLWREMQRLDPVSNALISGLEFLAEKITGSGEAALDSEANLHALNTTMQEAPDYAYNTADAVEEEGAAVEAAAKAQQKFNRELEIGTDLLYGARDAALASTDQMFALRDAESQAAESQEAVNDAIETYGEGSPEHIQAVKDLAVANLGVDAAQRAIVESGGLTREEFIKQQTDLGLTLAQAELLADELDRVNAFDPKPINFVVTVNGRTVAIDERGTIGFGSGGEGLGLRTGHSGMVVPGAPGQEVPILARAGEKILRPEQEIDDSAGLARAIRELARQPIVVMLNDKVVLEAVRRADRRLI